MFYTVEVEPYLFLNNSFLHVQSHIINVYTEGSTSFVEPTVCDPHLRSCLILTSPVWYTFLFIIIIIPVHRTVN